MVDHGCHIRLTGRRVTIPRHLVLARGHRRRHHVLLELRVRVERDREIAHRVDRLDRLLVHVARLLKEAEANVVIGERAPEAPDLLRVPGAGWAVGYASKEKQKRETNIASARKET